MEPDPAEIRCANVPTERLAALWAVALGTIAIVLIGYKAEANQQAEKHSTERGRVVVVSRKSQSNQHGRSFAVLHSDPGLTSTADM
jgi:hypothetical protein